MCIVLWQFRQLILVIFTMWILVGSWEPSFSVSLNLVYLSKAKKKRVLSQWTCVQDWLLSLSLSSQQMKLASHTSLPIHNKYMINIYSIPVLYHCLILSRTFFSLTTLLRTLLVVIFFSIGRLYCSENFNYPLSCSSTIRNWNSLDGALKEIFWQPCSHVLEPDNLVAVVVLFSFLGGHILSSPLFLYDTVFVGYFFSFFIFCIFRPHIRHIFYPIVWRELWAIRQHFFTCLTDAWNLRWS